MEPTTFTALERAFALINDTLSIPNGDETFRNRTDWIQAYALVSIAKSLERLVE